jgi:hypothetical protein
MDETETPKKSLFTRIRIPALLVLLAVLFAGFTHFFMNPRSGNQQVYDNLDVFGTRLQNLENSTILHEKRLKELEEETHRLASAPSPAPAPASASAPGSTEPASGPAPSDDRIAALEKEIAALKTASPQRDNESIFQSIRLLSAFHHLSEKVIGGKPFAPELSAFQELASLDEAAGSTLATLSPYAESGIPTFATLLATFDQAVEGLNATEAVPPAGADFWKRFTYNLAHLVSVRRIDEAQTGNAADAIVGRAQAHLEREEIEAAMTEIKSLPDTARGNFAAWLDDAQMVTEAPSLIDQLEEQIMQKIFHADGSATASKPAPAEPASTPQTSKP